MNEASDIDFHDGKTFLVIEDDADTGFIMKRRLETLFGKAYVHIVSGVLQGQRYLYKNKTDMIFLDLNLTDSYGISSVTEIMPYAQDTPVIITTGMASGVTRQESIKAGAKDLIMKSNITSDSLLEIVMKYSECDLKDS